jgi:hypothetical protein
MKTTICLIFREGTTTSTYFTGESGHHTSEQQNHCHYFKSTHFCESWFQTSKYGSQEWLAAGQTQFTRSLGWITRRMSGRGWYSGHFMRDWEHFRRQARNQNHACVQNIFWWTQYCIISRTLSNNSQTPPLVWVYPTTISARWTSSHTRTSPTRRGRIRRTCVDISS